MKKNKGNLIAVGILLGVVIITGSTMVSGSINFLWSENGISPVITYYHKYGEAWYHNHTATELTFESAGVYYNLSFDNSLVNGFIFNDADDNLEAEYPGTYKVCYHASGSGQNNHIYYTSVKIDGVVQEKCESHKKMAAGDDVTTMGGCCFITLLVGNVVNLATVDAEGTGVGNYYSSNINIIRVGN